MPHPVVHFEIACKDGEAGQKFYADLFGWKVNTDNPMKYGIVEKGGENGIGGGITGIFEGSESGNGLCVQCGDAVRGRH